MEQRRSDFALLPLRVIPAVTLIVFHGWGKLTAAAAHFIRGEEWRFIDSVGSLGFPIPAFFAVCAMLAETLAPLLVALGWFTRYAAAFVAFNMAVAVYRHVTSDMRYEMAGLYLIIAVTFLLAPPGRLSLDGLRRRK